MNKRLPYEAELLKQLNDLPLPDEQALWADLQRRLEEDKDDGIIVPPVKKGCLGYILLLFVLAVVLFIIVRPDNRMHDRKVENIISDEKVIKRETHEDSTINLKKGIQTNNHDTLIDKSRHFSVAGNKLLPGNNEEVNKNNYPKDKNGKQSRVLINNNEHDYDQKIKKNSSNSKNIEGKLKSTISNNEQNEDSPLKDIRIIPAENNSFVTNNNKYPDSIQTKISDSNNIKKEIKDTDGTNKIIKKDSTVKSLIYFSAGLALYQQLPVNGQKLTPYNSLGRKSSLGDYIPSVYFRINKEKKWFIQSEFRYGAPQFTKEIIYTQRKIIDTFTNTTTSTSKRLKKTFYHQLPVSFNYFILPHFSTGLGFTWNKFSSAVVEQEIKETNNITMVDSNQVTTILHSKKPDSNFVKSYFQALIEIQYEWKRFSLGTRYSFGLDPYLKFQLPGGQQKEEKNNTLQIFVRYNLWQLKKK